MKEQEDFKITVVIIRIKISDTVYGTELCL